MAIGYRSTTCMALALLLCVLPNYMQAAMICPVLQCNDVLLVTRLEAATILVLRMDKQTADVQLVIVEHVLKHDWGPTLACS